MANYSIGKMAIALGWGGQAAESGLARAKKGLESTGAAAKSSGGVWEAFTSKLKGMADVKATFDIFSGLVSRIRSWTPGIIDLGSELEQLQIHATYLEGNFKKGSASIADLREEAIKSGIPLETMSKAFSDLVSSGLSASAVKNLLHDTSAAVAVLGGGAGGAERLNAAFSSLSRGVLASEGTLESLQSGGLKVFEALAAELTRVTGRSYTAREAMKSLQEGTVLAGTAVKAIAAASQTPEAQAAATRFKNSYAGKLLGLKATANDIFMEIGKSLIDNLKITEALAGFKGFLSGIRDIVLEIGKNFSLMVDPLEKSGGIEASFKAARDFSYQFSESFAKGAAAFESAIRAGIIQLEAFLEKTSAAAQLGATGFSTGETQKVFEGIDAVTKMKLRPLDQRLQEANQKIEGFFDNLRNNAAKADQLAASEKAAAAAQAAAAAAGIELEKTAKGIEAALELSARNIKEWTRDTLESTATPIEALKKSFEQLGELMGQAAESGLALSEKELQSFQMAIARKAGKALAEFITSDENPDSYGAQAAVRGSAAGIESIIRNQFGQEGKSVQERIQEATVRNSILAQKQVEIQKAMLEALQRIPAPPAVLAMPK